VCDQRQVFERFGQVPRPDLTSSTRAVHCLRET
jgi:hypothetical protein